jgi:hypothetical protein
MYCNVSVSSDFLEFGSIRDHLQISVDMYNGSLLSSEQLLSYSGKSSTSFGPSSLLTCSQSPRPNQMNQVHKFSYIVMVHFNIILPSTLRSCRWPLPFGFATKIWFALRIPTKRSTCFAHPRPPWFEILDNIWWRIQIMKFPITQFPPATMKYDNAVETVSLNNLKNRIHQVPS